MRILKTQFDSNKLSNLEYLRLNKTSGKINSRLAIIKYKDKDTKQIIIYLPSLEISSYGETEIKANKMLNTCLVEYFDFLLKSSFEKVGKELSKLGWKHDKFRKKEFHIN